MAGFTTDELDKLQEAIQSLKLYRRAELENSQGEDLIEKLYVDPLPNDHVHKLLRQSNTTFLIGRKGTGKSTVFLRAQKSLLGESQVLSTYVDIKTVFESAQADPKLVENLSKVEGALPQKSMSTLLLMTSFLRAVVSGIRDDLAKQLVSSWKLRVIEVFTGGYEELSRGLDKFIEDLGKPEFINAQGIRTPHVRGLDRNERNNTLNVSAKGDIASGVSGSASAETSRGNLAETEKNYSDVLLRIVDIRQLILGLKSLLEPLNIRHLYVFLDDFSELPLDAMQTVVDILMAPLNNWSEELVKFKVAAYPGRIYYGGLDKSKIDEVSLDLHNLYGQASVQEMETKGVDFTRRLVTRRFEHFELQVLRYIDSRNSEIIWRSLFQASMGNPRVLGYILFFIYESHLLYSKPITVSAVRDAAKRYFEDKIESYFLMGRFLHESFAEKTTIFSLKELLEQIIKRARHLRSKDTASIFRKIEGQHPTSHFNISQNFDALLSTLELNFFLTKYYVMSNRDGRRVSVYALNYGLCEKYSIGFGRPSETREQRLYFVERVFDYNSIIQDFIANDQEIKCDNCSQIFESEDLEALKRFNMLCPNCRVGTCKVTSISRKYEDVIRNVKESELLPATELGILQTLSSESKALMAGEIAGELDVSYQLIGKRAKRLDEQNLIDREMVGGRRREYQLSDLAKRIYFNAEDSSVTELEIEKDETETS